MSGDGGSGSLPVPRPEPEWVRHAILWQVYPLGFTGAPISRQAQDAAADGGADGSHSLERLVGWLDYAVELGVSGLLLGPIFASETHGYDTVDYLRIDPRLDGLDGGGGSFDRLVTEAHSRGLRVILDGVFNHVGRSFGPFQRALAGGPSAPEFRLFRPVGDTPSDPTQQSFANFEGHDALVLLNHDEPAVADLVADVMNHWLARGVDGWRLDAAYAVPPEFWALVLPRVRNEHPESFVFGEVIHGDYARIVADSGLDSVTQYELWKAIWSSISDANFWELSAALERHNDFLEHFVPVTFVGNHDVTRLASAIADERHRPHALVALFTTGGTPTVYYGDEQGLLAVKEEREGGDDAVRPEYPAAGPSALGADPSASATPAADPAAFAVAGPSPAFPADGWHTYHLHQHLIGLRRRHPWLHAARTRNLALTNTFLAYEVTPAPAADTPAAADAQPTTATSASPRDRLIVLLNLADTDYLQKLPGSFVVVAGAAAIQGDRAGTSATVPPHGWAVVEPN